MGPVQTEKSVKKLVKMMADQLKEMKIRIEMIALDIENLEGDQRVQAVKHLEESLEVLKLGSFQQFGEPHIKTETLELKKEGLAETNLVPVDSLSYPNLYNGLVPTCSECQQTFPTLGLLDTHMKKLHAETYRENVSKSKAEISRKSKAIVSSSSPKVEKNIVSQEIEMEELTSPKIETVELISEKTKKEEVISQKLIKVEETPEKIVKEELAVEMVEMEELAPEKIEKEELVKKKLKKKNLIAKKLEEKKLSSPKGGQIPEKPNQDDKKLFPCADCEKSFGNRNSLRKHKVCHTDRHKCQTCGKGFSQNRDLENHHKTQSCSNPTSEESSHTRGA